MSRSTAPRLVWLWLGMSLALSSAASAQIVGYNPNGYRPVAPQPQRGPPCGHYGTPACPPPPLTDLDPRQSAGLSGEELWVEGSRRVQMHDWAGAVPYFKRSAELGDTRGEAAFGRALISGKGVQQDVATGLAWLRRSADSGDRGGEFELGELYANGAYVTKDMARAIRLYDASARKGFGPAEREMAVAYALGDGVPRNREVAIGLLQEAAAFGQGDAWPRQMAWFISQSRTRYTTRAQFYAAFNTAIANGAAGYFTLPPPRGPGLSYGSCTGPYASAACAHSAYSGVYAREHPD